MNENDDNYWFKLRADILKAENLNQIQLDQFKFVLSHFNQINNSNDAYFSNLLAIYSLKIINDCKKCKFI
jgi:hypothetical protein